MSAAPRTTASLSVWLVFFFACAMLPRAGSAQAQPQRAFSVVSLLGFGVVSDGDWSSVGLEAALDLVYGGTDWQWSVYGSWRGLGVGCSEACFDGGPALAVGVSRSIGRFWLGAGAGAMHEFGRWRPLPYARISVERAPFRIDLRVELPQEEVGGGVYLPLLLGYALW